MAPTNPPTLANLPIAKMVPAITARLRLGFPEATFSLERVPQTISLQEFERIVLALPFLGLAWRGMRPDKKSGRALMGVMQWRLFLVNKASSTNDARFSGDAFSIGLDPMTDLAIALLHFWSVDTVGHSAVTGADAIYADGLADEAIVLSQVDFEIRFATSAADLALVSPADFQHIANSWTNAGSADPANGPVITNTDNLQGGAV